MHVRVRLSVNRLNLGLQFIVALLAGLGFSILPASAGMVPVFEKEINAKHFQHTNGAGRVCDKRTEHALVWWQSFFVLWCVWIGCLIFFSLFRIFFPTRILWFIHSIAVFVVVCLLDIDAFVWDCLSVDILCCWTCYYACYPVPHLWFVRFNLSFLAKVENCMESFTLFLHIFLFFFSDPSGGTGAYPSGAAGGIFLLYTLFALASSLLTFCFSFAFSRVSSVQGSMVAFYWITEILFAIAFLVVGANSGPNNNHVANLIGIACAGLNPVWNLIFVSHLL